MIPIIAAFQFLTIFPTLIKRMFSAQEMGRSVAWFPFVGLALGAALYGVNYSAGLIFPDAVSAALTLCAWVIFTRAFHLDGFMDSCDGLFGGFTLERRLEIMKDSRVGVFGVAGGVLILLIQYASLGSSLHILPAIVLAATLGRWVSSFMIHFLPYAREDGLGSQMKRNVGLKEVLLSTLIAGVISWFMFSWIGLALMLASMIFTFLVALYVMRLLPGLTGDIYGAMTVMVETLVLLFFTVRF
jgi:adenosylcobinamide-GDP ribazoletransferase